MADLKQAYMFYGDDAVRIQLTRKRLIERVAGDGGELESVDCKSTAAQSAAMLIGQQSLMTTGPRVVLLDGIDAWKAAEIGSVADAVTGLQPDTTVVLISAKKPVKAIEAALAEHGCKAKEFAAPKAKALPGWVAEQAAATGIEIDPDAARLLVDVIGDRQQRLLSELQKLAVFVGDRGKITASDVGQISFGETTPKVFALGDAAVESGVAATLSTAEDLVAGGERPHSLVYTLSRTFGQAGHALALAEHGKTGEAAEIMGVSPWLASKAAGNGRQIGAARAQSAMIDLAGLDYALKGGSSLDNETELTKTLIAIAE